MTIKGLYPDMSFIELIKLARSISDKMGLVLTKNLLARFMSAYEGTSITDTGLLHRWVKLVKLFDMGAIQVTEKGDIFPVKTTPFTDEQIRNML